MSSGQLGMGFVVVALMMIVPLVSATQYKVGDGAGWSVPSSNSMSYGQWAESRRFFIGDSLLFVYPPNKDSVFQVSKEDYSNCNSASPIAHFNDGNTVFTLKNSGPYYFISGIKDNCLNKENLVVVVMADRNNQGSTNQQGSPANSGSTKVVGGLGFGAVISSFLMMFV